MYKKLLLIVFLICTLVQAPIADAYVYVKGYYRNGTYVKSHVRSNPNALKYDNYSYTGGSRYNKTYYYLNKTYNPSWYQPSWKTDVNYYKGLSIYNSYKNTYTTPSYNYFDY